MTWWGRLRGHRPEPDPDPDPPVEVTFRAVVSHRDGLAAPPAADPDPDRPGCALPNTPDDWAADDEWTWWRPPLNIVVGESFYQPALWELCGPERPGVRVCRPVDVVLVRDPANEHDENAIAAVVQDLQVGYLSARLAAGAAPVLDDLGLEGMVVCGVLRGMWDEDGGGNFGCHIWFDRRLVPGPHFEVEGLDERSRVGGWPPDPEEVEELDADWDDE